MLRSWTALAVATVMVGAACAEAPAAAEQKPVSQTTKSPAASPTPSPSPSPLAPLRISAAPFHPGEIGFGYSPVTATAAGGTPPYAWDLADGALPTGLTLSADGKVTGTPATLGTFLFTVRVTDTSSGSATLTSSISISKRLVITGQPCTPRSPCSVEAGCVTVCGAFAYFTNGIGPYKFGVVSGSLPTGMGLNALALTNAFPNPPAGTTGKDWVFTVRVTDAIGATAQTTAQFHVFPHIAFSGPTTSTCTTTGGTGCTLAPSLTYTLGTPGLAKVTAVITGLPAGQQWPSGAAFTAQGGTVTAITCSAAYHGTVSGVVTIALQDISTCATSRYCTSGTATVTVKLTC